MGPCSNSTGDPHLTTFDGLNYDFQGAGEFILTKLPNEPFEIQVRQEPWGNSNVVAVNTAVAMDVGDDRVSFDVRSSRLLFVNGQQQTQLPVDGLELPQGGRIAGDMRKLVVDWPDRSKRLIIRRSGDHLDLRVSLAEEKAAQAVGLLGNRDGRTDNDLVTRDGTVLSRRPLTFDQLYKQFGESWRIRQAESLFDYRSGNDTETFTDRDFPERILTVQDLDPEKRDSAEQTCREAGVTDQIALQNCVLDVGVTGDDDFAESAASPETSGNSRTKLRDAVAKRKGDPNGNGVVSTVDARMCLQAAQGLISLTAKQQNRCNVDNDGQLDRDDAIEIARRSLGLISSFGAGGIAVLGVLLLGLSTARGQRRPRWLMLLVLAIGLSGLLTACSGLLPVTPQGTTGLTAVVRFDAIELHAQAMPDGGLAALGVRSNGLTFDPDLIKVTGIEPADGWTVLAQQLDNDRGDVQFAVVNPTEGVTKGTVLTLHYQAKPTVFERAALGVTLNASQLTLGDADNKRIVDTRTRTAIPAPEEVEDHDSTEQSSR